MGCVQVDMQEMELHYWQEYGDALLLNYLLYFPTDTAPQFL